MDVMTILFNSAANKSFGLRTKFSQLLCNWIPWLKKQQQLCNLASGAAGLSGAATAAVAGVGAAAGAAAVEAAAVGAAAVGAAAEWLTWFIGWKSAAHDDPADDHSPCWTYSTLGSHFYLMFSRMPIHVCCFWKLHMKNYLSSYLSMFCRMKKAVASYIGSPLKQHSCHLRWPECFVK